MTRTRKAMTPRQRQKCITRLERAAIGLETQAGKMWDLRAQLILEKVIEESPIKVGDVAEIRIGPRTTRRYRITEVYARLGAPAYKGRNISKSGRESTVVADLKWHTPKLIEKGRHN